MRSDLVVLPEPNIDSYLGLPYGVAETFIRYANSILKRKMLYGSD